MVNVEIDEWAIGQRIASHRTRRGLTQDELAGLVGISLSMMKKIETGDRLVTRFSQLVLFAQALRVKDLRDLTGVPLQLMPDGRRGHPAVGAVYSALMVRGTAQDEPRSLDDLADAIDRTWRTWQEPSVFRYEAVGRHLPGLLHQAQTALVQCVGEDRRRALGIASRLYQLTRTWTKRVGEHELSMIAADRAVSCALDADDPDLAGASAWNLGMILSAQGRTEQSRAVVTHAIEALAQQLGQPSQARLAVFGGLHLLGATEAARDDNAPEARRLLDEAERIAAKTGETNHFRMVFGPSNVMLHRVSTAVELGRTSDALELADRVPVQAIQAVERRLTFRLDAARCYVRKRNDIAAVHMLQHVHRESPEELGMNPLARETLRELKGRAKPAIGADLEPLLVAANLPA
jgi:transcriptional regulator with XRE-family HTH domain